MGQAGAAEPDPGAEECAADPVVVGHGPDDLIDISAVLVAQLGELVGEADLGREEEVGAELAQRGVGRAHLEDRRVHVAIQPAQAVRPVALDVVGDSENHPLGLKEILDGGPFLGELGVEQDRHLAEPGLLAHSPDDDREVGEEPRRQGRANHEDGVLREPRDDVVETRLDRPGLPAAVAVMGPHGDEDDLGLADRGRIGGERQAPRIAVDLNQLTQARLMERHPSIEQCLDPTR